MISKIINTTNTRRLSFFTSLAITLFISLFYFISTFLIKEVQFSIYILLILSLSVFLFSFVLFSYVLNVFIYDKIRLIYKTVRNLKLQKDAKPELNFKDDIIKEVKEEVEDWGKKHKQEISILKDREKFRREFIGNISHELKNPVFNIQGYIYSLMHGANEDTKLSKQYLKRTSKNVDRIITIIEDLDTISELEVKDIKTDFKPFDILCLTEDVIELFDEKCKKKNITIFFREKYTGPLKVIGDENRIKQVLVNLIDNGIKYNYENSRIKISFFDMDKNYLIEITDEGQGISAKDLPRIFERFYRTDKARSRDKGGTGLGLSIVKHIIESHKQTINVRSSPGVGTTFAFTMKKA